jgi:small subunit ribosomal protein S4
MAKYIGPVCRICRREGEKLYLKGERCFSPKCAFEKRAFAPGQHGRTGQGGGGGRGGGGERVSDYARQLRAKQKARRIYNIFERQFRRYYSVAMRRRGLTGLNLLQILETRLDNVVFRLGFTENRAQARLLVSHGHFTVNGIRSNIPSMLIRPGDMVAVRDGSRKTTFFKEMPDLAANRNGAVWLERDVKAMSGRLVRFPERSEIDGNMNEQLIVEYYSR